MKVLSTPIVHISIRGGAVESVDCDQPVNVIITDWDNYQMQENNLFREFYAEVVTRRNLAASLHQAKRARR